MTRCCAIGLVAAALALAGCGATAPEGHVLRLASADPLGLEHDPAVARFVDRVEQLSGGRLRVAVDERWGSDLTAREVPLLRAVARGEADLGWAHASSFDQVGVQSFEPLLAPLLVDRDAVQDAVVGGPIGVSMLAGVRHAGLEGLALLAGPFSRLVGADAPARDVDDLRGTLVAIRDSASARAAIGALGGQARPFSPSLIPLLYVNAEPRPGQPTGALERSLDELFFDRYGGPCPPPGPTCATLVPWVTRNVVLWPRTAVLVGNPARLQGLTSQDRTWVREAAADAARSSTTTVGDDAGAVAELCAAGARFTVASPAARQRLRTAWAPVYRRLATRPDARAAVAAIRRLRARAPAATPLRVPAGCRPRPAGDTVAHGIRSTLPDGIYRTRLSAADVRRAGAVTADARAGTATLTLRGGRWRLVLAEPGHDVRTGTYAGSTLRTVWATDGPERHEAYISVEVAGDGALRFRVGGADELASARATYASHPWRRIGS